MNGTARSLLAIALSGPVFGQTAPSFEVASIKANRSGHNGMGNHFTEEQMSWTNVPLFVLIAQVNRLRNYQVIGAPAWTHSENWDIDAKSAGKSTMAEKSAMLATLLADRFHLQFHRETREMPVYRLVIAKGGVKMKEVKEGEKPDHTSGISNQASHLMGWAQPVAMLVDFLSGSYLNEPVIDATGLTGNYDFDLKWTPDPNQAYQRDEAADPNGPSLLAAIQEQLGLKLEATKGAVEVLVIDRVERPAEN